MFASVLCGLLISCDQPTRRAAKADEDSDFFKGEAQHLPHLHQNQLQHGATGFLRSRSGDTVHWQPWSPQLLADAKAEQRLIFALLGSGKFPNTIQLLDQFLAQSALSKLINDRYLCTLIDIEAHPEMALQLGGLAGEIGRPITFPGFIWFSHEGNPVAWLPLSNMEVNNFDEVFGSAELMVSGIWEDSPRYVVNNSAHDNTNRIERIVFSPSTDTSAEATLAILRSSARKLAVLYDPATETLDGGGGLLPTSLLHFAGCAISSPLIPDRTDQKFRELVQGVSSQLMRGAIRDPLAGGFFSARRSRGWDLPQTFKTNDTQANAALAFSQNALASDHPVWAQVAVETLAYAERRFSAQRDGQGSYVVYLDRELTDRAFFWSEARLTELLTPEELAVATQAYGITALGNIPIEQDPRRDYFHQNSLGQKLTSAEVAAALGTPPAQTADLLEQARQRLLAQQHEILSPAGASFTDPTRITASNARTIQALVSTTRSTGDEAHLQRAQTLLRYLREHHYSPEGGLLRIAKSEDQDGVRARGEDYSALLVALFHIYRLDLDPTHLEWALTLAEEAIETLGTEDHLLLERPPGEAIGDFPLYSHAMIFGDSTWGTIYGPLVRLTQLAPNSTAFPPIVDALHAHLLPDTDTLPLVHTDFLMALLIPLTDTVVQLEGIPGTPEFDSLHQVLLQAEFDAITIIHRQETLPEALRASLPPATGTAKARILVAGEALGDATSGPALQQLLRDLAPGT